MSAPKLPDGPYYRCDEQESCGFHAPGNHRPSWHRPGDLRLIGGTWMCKPCWLHAGYFRGSDGWSWETDFITLADELEPKTPPGYERVEVKVREWTER